MQAPCHHHEHFCFDEVVLAPSVGLAVLPAAELLPDCTE